jgi:hypothetical protein
LSKIPCKTVSAKRIKIVSIRIRRKNQVVALTTQSIPVEASDICHLMIMTKTA